MTNDRLATWLAEHGEPRFRAAQIRHWLFGGRAHSLDEMSDLPKALREALAADFQLWTTRIAAHKKCDDGTEKLLVELADRQQIECVLLRDGPRRTICISTQVGCAMGCVFCASGLTGVARNLTAGEIVEQMLLLDRLLPADERLSHIVVMGMGEPLANLDALLPALAEAVRRPGWASVRGASRFQRWDCRARFNDWCRRTAAATWPSRCMRRTTSCETSS